MSNAIYKPEVVIPTLRTMLREPNAPERIADLVIQIQQAAYLKGRHEVVSSVMNAVFATCVLPDTARNPNRVTA